MARFWVWFKGLFEAPSVELIEKLSKMKWTDKF